MKIENDENSILKRLQWSIAANPRIEPINNDVLRAREERKILLSEFKEITLKVRVQNSAKFRDFEVVILEFSKIMKISTFFNSVESNDFYRWCYPF